MPLPRDDGYTLLELLVVLGILGLVAALAVPVAAQVVDGVMLETDARALVTVFRHLESMAVARQETIAVTEKDGKLLLSSGDALELPDSGVARLAHASDKLEFYPDGTSNGGRVSICHGDRSLDVEIDWLSGEVKLADEQ